MKCIFEYQEISRFIYFAIANLDNNLTNLKRGIYYET